MPHYFIRVHVLRQLNLLALCARKDVKQPAPLFNVTGPANMALHSFYYRRLKPSSYHAGSWSSPTGTMAKKGLLCSSKVIQSVVFTVLQDLDGFFEY